MSDTDSKYLFSKYFSSSSSVPGTILSDKDVLVNQT